MPYLAAHHTGNTMQRPYHRLHSPAESGPSHLSDLTPTTCPLAHFTVVTLAFSLFLQHAKPAPTSGPLHMLLLLPRYHSSPSSTPSSSLISLSSSLISTDLSVNQSKTVPYPDLPLHAAPEFLMTLAWRHSLVGLLTYGLPPTSSQKGLCLLHPALQPQYPEHSQTRGVCFTSIWGLQLLQRQYFHGIFWSFSFTSVSKAQILSLKD